MWWDRIQLCVQRWWTLNGCQECVLCYLWQTTVSTGWGCEVRCMCSSRTEEQTSELTVFFMQGDMDLILTDFLFMSFSVRLQRQIKDQESGQTGMLLLFLDGFIDHWTSCRAQYLWLFRERPFWEGVKSGFLCLRTTNAPAGFPNAKLCLDQGCTHILPSCCYKTTNF